MRGFYIIAEGVARGINAGGNESTNIRRGESVTSGILISALAG